MKKLQQRFSIDYTYQVIFTKGLFKEDNDTLSSLIIQDSSLSTTKIAFVIDEGVAQHHPGLLAEISRFVRRRASQLDLSAKPLLVPGGERSKNDLEVLQSVLELTHLAKLDRHAYLIAIGGGAVLDMVGFAAAIAHRGIRHIRIPTTVLSQNDSGVGVKNSFNFFGKKNYLGTFAPPVAVINDSNFLQTLELRDWRAGMSEAVKVSLIKDAAFFEWLERNAESLMQRQTDLMDTLIYRCAKWHLNHIATAGDPFEQGSSRPLDFGHWAAHKLEQLSNYEIRHGEAVALGIALDVSYAKLKGYLDKSHWQRILRCLSDLGFDLFHPLFLDSRQERINSELLNGLEEFREHLGGELTIMLIKAIGQGFEVHAMDSDTIEAAALELLNYANSTQQPSILL